MSQDVDKLLRPDQAARRLGVTDQHVRRLVRQGKVPAARLSQRNIRIAESALLAYQEELNRLEYEGL